MRTFTYDEVLTLICENKALKKQVEDFRSGEKYVQLQEMHRKELAAKDREIAKHKKKEEEAHRETKKAREKWLDTFGDMERDFNKVLAETTTVLQRLQNQKFDAERKLDETRALVKELRKLIKKLGSELEKTRGAVTKLKTRINRDHTNSSKSSGENPNHEKITNGRTPSGKNPGGQPGHEHHPRKDKEATEFVRIPVPEKYLDTTKYRPTGNMKTKKLVKLRLVADVIEYSTPEFIDLETGKTVHAPFPEGMSDELVYDGTVKAMAYLLNNECNVSIGKTKEFLKNVSHGAIDISTGMICKLAKEFAKKTEAERNDLFLELFASEGKMVRKQRLWWLPTGTRCSTRPESLRATKVSSIPHWRTSLA